MAIDIEALSKPLDGDSPCGEDISYDNEYLQLEDMIFSGASQGGDENSDAEPDWRKVKDISIKLLKKSRDLRVATYLTLAELCLNGLEGLREGLKLLEHFVCNLWDNVHPQLDPEDDYDPLERLNILNSLSPDAAVYQDSMMFIQRLRNVPICDAPRIGKFSLRDIMIANKEIEPLDEDEHVDLNVIRAAFMDTPVEKLNQTLEAVNDSLQSLMNISNFLTEKLGTNNTANFSALEHELNSIKKRINEYLSQRGAGEEEGQDSEQDTAESEVGEEQVSAQIPIRTQGKATSMDSISNRSDVLRMLDKICDYYDAHEPGSPVPLLLRRAQKLVNMSFYDILEDIAPDALSQAQIVLGNKIQQQTETEEES